MLCILCYIEGWLEELKYRQKKLEPPLVQNIVSKAQSEGEFSADEARAENIHLGSRPTQKFILTISVTKTLVSFGEEGCFTFLTQVYLSTKPLCVVCVCERKGVKHLLLITWGIVRTHATQRNASLHCSLLVFSNISYFTEISTSQQDIMKIYIAIGFCCNIKNTFFTQFTSYCFVSLLFG